MRILKLCLAGLCLLLFTASATTDLALPGPQDDEILQACLAIDLMRPPYPYGQYTLRLGQQPFPFGMDAHTGALKAYLLWPLFALFGPSVELSRLLNVSLGIVVLLFFFFYARETMGFWPAFFALFFLSLDTSFIFYAKLEPGPILELLLWMMICLWGFTKWRQSGRFRYLFPIPLSWVFGTYGHISFVWFITAFLIAAFLLYRQEAKKLFEKPAVTWVLFSLSLAFLIFLHWLIGDSSRWLPKESPGLAGLWEMFGRLSRKGGLLPELLVGKAIRDVPSLGLFRPLTDFFLAVSMLSLFYLEKRHSREFWFLLVVLGVILLEMAVTPGGYMIYPQRMMFVYVLFILFAGKALAAALGRLRRAAGERLGATIVSLGVVGLALVSCWGQVSLQLEGHREIRQTGGKGYWSDGIYSVVETLERGKWEKTICFNWGYPTLFTLGRGKIPLEVFPWDVYAASHDERLKRLSQMMQEASPQVPFLLNVVWYKGSVTVQELKEAVAMANKRLQLEYFFHDRQGDPIYAAYTVHPG